MGVQKIANGTVEVLDCAAGTPLLRRHIGYMAQGSSVYDNLTVVENVQYFRRLLALCHSEVDRVLGLVELMPQKHQLVASLSGGQKARVSLAVALLGTPPLLILDEPTVGLDPLLRDKLWHLFADLAGAGTSLIISSHVMDEAKRCDHLLLLRDGQLIAQGSATTLQQQTNAKDLEAAFIALATRQEASHD
jgi:ABC-2 type transport system ATP-binding protein